MPTGFRWERLKRNHPRRRFSCGQPEVGQWLRTKAWRHQKKHLSVTKVLLDADDAIAGYYTLATGQVDFSDLPAHLAKRLANRIGLQRPQDIMRQAAGIFFFPQPRRSLRETVTKLLETRYGLGLLKNIPQRINVGQLPDFLQHRSSSAPEANVQDRFDAFQ
jgi:hypothetical protein